MKFIIISLAYIVFFMSSATSYAELDEARKDRQDERFAYFSQTGIPEKQWVVWGAEKDIRPKYKKFDVFTVMNEINLEYQRKISIPYNMRHITTAPKGEFETTAEYDKRIKRVKERHQEKFAKKESEIKTGAIGKLEDIFNDILGSPTLSGAKYNADKKYFSFKIKLAKDYKISGGLDMPEKKAKELKRKLEHMRPWVMFRFDGQHLTPYAAMLQDGSKSVGIEISRTKIQTPFTAENADVYMIDNKNISSGSVKTSAQTRTTVLQAGRDSHATDPRCRQFIEKMNILVNSTCPVNNDAACKKFYSKNQRIFKKTVQRARQVGCNI